MSDRRGFDNQTCPTPLLQHRFKKFSRPCVCRTLVRNLLNFYLWVVYKPFYNYFHFTMSSSKTFFWIFIQACPTVEITVLQLHTMFALLYMLVTCHRDTLFVGRY